MKDNHGNNLAGGQEDFAVKAGYVSYSEMLETLEGQRTMGVQDADPAALTDLESIHIDGGMTLEDRISSLLQQAKNPYCFRYNGMIVKLSYAGKQSIEDCLASCFFTD